MSSIQHSNILKNVGMLWMGWYNESKESAKERRKRNDMRTAKQIERYFKGASNHYRIGILLLVAERPNMTVDGITKELKGNFKTISEHTRRLVQAGLLNKRYQGRSVAHTLSPYGQRFVKFIKTFQHS